MTETVLISERERIIEEVTTLFNTTDNRDWPAVRSCFSENVLFNTSLTDGQPEVVSSDQIVRWWEEGLKDLDALHHQIGNFIVKFKDNGADVSCYGLAYHYLPNRTNRNTKIFVGSYNIHLTNIEGKWEIDQFKFNSKFVAGNLNLGE